MQRSQVKLGERTASGNPVVRNLRPTDGLPLSEVLSLEWYDDRLWVGARDGLYSFDPRLLSARVNDRDVPLLGLRINGKKTGLNKKLLLEHDQNNLEIDYTGIAIGRQLSFEFRMIGQDSSWTPTAARSARYTTLPPGKYRFQVRSIDKNQSRSPITSWEFQIEPAWWQTWWFKAAAVLALALVVGWLFRIRLAQAKERADARANIQTRIAQIEMKALRAQMNPHFTFNTMNAIQHYIANNESEAAQRYLARFGRLMRLILQNSGEQNVTLEEETEQLALYAELEGLRFDEPFEFVVSMDDSIDPTYDRIPPMLLQPFVENAVWHRLAHRKTPGKITVSLSRKGETVID